MTSADDPTAGRPPSEVRLASTAAITSLGTLAWLAWVWVLTLAVFAVVLTVVVVRGGDFDQSLWQGLGAGWQRWVVAAAGATMVPVFAPMLVTNCVTRARLSASASVAMVATAVTGAAVIRR